jgi:uncharacterized protein YndB with AHSA1/START domain
MSSKFDGTFAMPMAVDVVTEVDIARPRAQVSAFACDPDNAKRWYENIERVEWETEPPLAIGSRVAFVARFLGRRLAYTYEIRELEPGERLVMSTADVRSRWRRPTRGRTRPRAARA